MLTTVIIISYRVLGKLREGLVASKRRDLFAVEGELHSPIYQRGQRNDMLSQCSRLPLTWLYYLNLHGTLPRLWRIWFQISIQE